MKILFVTSEVAPFSKTGGLADVCGALPKALAAQGHEVCVISPYYRMVAEWARQAGVEMERHITEPVVVPVGEQDKRLGVVGTRLPASEVEALFLECPDYYDRPQLYVDTDGSDFPDNCARFTALCRGALELAETLGLEPDIVHAHDWQTGLVPVYLKTLYRERHSWERAASVFTIHNIVFQGIFWHWDMKVTGLAWDLFNWRMLEYYGKLSLLKAGLVFADCLTTVSRRYAEEIQTEAFGAGMESVLQQRSQDLYGIVNGIDYGTWSPEADRLIPARYGREDLGGKAACKAALLERFALDGTGAAPLLGMVTRLTEQKGLDLVEAALPALFERGAQVVILGKGDPRYHESLSALAEKHPGRLGLMLAYDNETAHLIEAGADMFLMPSRFEPCGLNQLYSLRYGTVPVVRRTGGLADTVVDYTPGTQRAGMATGFVFDGYAAEELVAAVDRALQLWKDKPAWRRLMRTCMAQDWSWDRSAEQYQTVYEAALEKLTE
jgi:starch synthase